MKMAKAKNGLDIEFINEIAISRCFGRRTGGFFFEIFWMFLKWKCFKIMIYRRAKMLNESYFYIVQLSYFSVSVHLKNIVYVTQQ